MEIFRQSKRPASGLPTIETGLNARFNTDEVAAKPLFQPSAFLHLEIRLHPLCDKFIP
jgi:hypothetical protein